MFCVLGTQFHARVEVNPRTEMDPCIVIIGAGRRGQPLVGGKKLVAVEILRALLKHIV